jgi:hypothetical protein
MTAKYYLIIPLMILTLTCFAQMNNELVGTWKMVSGKTTQGDSTIPNDMDKFESIKIVTPTHFAVFGKNKANGSLTHALAGTVKMSGDQYTETITYGSETTSSEPMIAKFTSKLEGSKWHIIGGFGNYKFDEIWEKVK